jgi:hypothetical protein
MARYISQKILDVGNNSTHNYRAWEIIPFFSKTENNSMKKIFQLGALALLPAGTHLYAHTPPTGTADEEIYTMAESPIAGTANALPGFNERGDAITRTSITTNSLSMFETLAARGDLVEYIESLDGVVDTAISLNDDGSVTMTVNQLR